MAPGSCVCDAWSNTAGISVYDARPNSAGMSVSNDRLNSPGVSVSDARLSKSLPVGIRAEVTRVHVMLGHLGLARRLPMLG